MSQELLIKNVRPLAGEPVDLLVRGGRIAGRCHVIDPRAREIGGEVTLTLRPSRSAIRSSLRCETDVMSFG